MAISTIPSSPGMGSFQRSASISLMAGNSPPEGYLSHTDTPLECLSLPMLRVSSGEPNRVAAFECCLRLLKGRMAPPRPVTAGSMSPTGRHVLHVSAHAALGRGAPGRRPRAHPEHWEGRALKRADRQSGGGGEEWGRGGGGRRQCKRDVDGFR